LEELQIYNNGATDLLFEGGALPKLVKLDMSFTVSWAKANGFYLGIGHLPCLKYGIITLRNRNHASASSSENRAAAAAIRNETNSHPNHPSFKIRRGEQEEVFEEDGDSNEEES
jgi:disease resistance protein RPM1